MKIVRVSTDTRYDIGLGCQGENLARTLEFDVSEWRAEYGEGTVQLLHRRSGDRDPYPAAIQQEGDVVRWPVTAADTAMFGTGRLQLLYFVGGALVKQLIRKTFVAKSLGQPGEAPEPARAWVEQVLAEAAKITGMTATAVELPAGAEPTAEYADGVLTIGIPMGADGKSAYQYAQECGYTGTEAEFAAKLAEEIPAVDSTLTQSGNAADAKAVGDQLSALSEEIADCIKSPDSAEVGQIVKISAVDDAWKPTAWEAVDMPEQVQADWNQNDSTAAGYVKNRPFYSETRNVTVENAVDVVLEGFPTFVAGDTVTVNVDGVEHSLVAYDDEGIITIGDTYSSLKNGEGQLGWQIYVDERVFFYATEAHTVSYLGTVYHTIDKKYLPIGIQLNAVDGEIYLDQDNKTYILSDGLVFDSLIGKRVLLLGDIYYILSAMDNTVLIYSYSNVYKKESDDIVFSVTVYLLSSDGTYTNTTKRITLT